MNHKTQVDLITELHKFKASQSEFLDACVTQQSVSQYFDDAVFKTENAAIFLKWPNAVAHASELPDAGSFVTRTLAGRSILLARGDDNQVHAFLNVCRHRGTQLETKSSGCAQRFTCPYHAWSYSPEGELLAAPQFESGFTGRDRLEFNLTPVPVCERFGLIWVIPAATAEPNFETVLDPLAEDLAALDMDTMQIAAQYMSTRKANWKILVEGGLEAYHFKVAHRDTIGPYFARNLSSYQMLGPHIRSILPKTTLFDLESSEQDQWRLRDHANVLYTLFPTTQLLVQKDHVVWISQNPISASKTQLTLSTLVPASRMHEETYWARNHDITTKTLIEDFDIAESIQAGLTSGANTEFTFARFEGALAAFHDVLNAELAR
jgi:phenylpropionate dioxygenase-like ring-hydroxylating dioxygenase large terminal subunit